MSVNPRYLLFCRAMREDQDRALDMFRDACTERDVLLHTLGDIIECDVTVDDPEIGKVPMEEWMKERFDISLAEGA